MQDHLTKLNNKKSFYQRLLRTVIDDLEAMGEKKLETFVSDQLVVSKVPISQKLTLNKVKITDHTGTGQLKGKAEFFSIQICIKEN